MGLGNGIYVAKCARPLGLLVIVDKFGLKYASNPNDQEVFDKTMPTLEVVSLQDAQLELSLTGKRGAIIRQYMEYIGQLEPGKAAKLTPAEGETTAAIRRRLGAAAQLLGKNLVVNRQGDVVYFWEEGSGITRRRRGRPRKTDSE